MLSGDELKMRPNCGLNDWFQAGNLNFCMTGTAAYVTHECTAWLAAWGLLEPFSLRAERARRGQTVVLYTQPSAREIPFPNRL